LSMLINSATASMLRRRFCRTISPIFSVLASVFDVVERPGRWSSPISSPPSLNLLNHSKTWVRDTLITINYLQQIVRFRSGFSKFHTEFHIDALLHVNTEHDSDGEQEHDPLQAKVANPFAPRPWNCNCEWRGEHKPIPHIARCYQVYREVGGKKNKSGYFIATPRMLTSF